MKTRLTRPPTKSEKSYDLIRRLSSRRMETRRAAQTEFLRMAVEAPALFHADLADLIQVITGPRRKNFLSAWAPATLVSMALAISCCSSLADYLVMPRSQILDVLLIFGWSTLLLFLVGLILRGIYRRSFDRRNRRLTECMTDIEDLDTLPALIELLEFAAPSMLDAITPPMTRLLLRIRAADGHLLGSLHRAALVNALHTPRNRRQPAAFFVAVLQAIEQIGDPQALPTVARLAHGRGIAGEHPAVHDAAQRCLAQLQELNRCRQAPSLLLRPSDPAADSLALPRPVAASPDTAPYELLRTAGAPLNRL